LAEISKGVRYDTYCEACLVRGILQDDGEWCLCLSEAAQMQTGGRLRHLFATLLLFCNPTEPLRLWEEFRVHICDGLDHRLRRMGFENHPDSDIYDYGLFLLGKILQDSGHFLADFGMPTPERDWAAAVEKSLVAKQLDYDPAE
jgi:hypothetical protein